MAGFLNDLAPDLAKVEANPNFIADGLYPAHVYESKIMDTKNGKQWAVTFRIDDDSPKHAGKQKVVFLALNIADADPDREFKLSLLKKMPLDLGIPESRLGDFMPAEVIGAAVDIRVKNKSGYSNVTEIKLRDAVGNGSPRAAVPSSVSGPATSGDALKGLM